MTLLQALLTKLLPRKWAAEMEAESRDWMMRCPQCNHERSIWEAGGIRWKAAGNPKRWIRCPQCGTTARHTLHRQSEVRPM